MYLLALVKFFDTLSRWDTIWFYMINLQTQNGFFDLIMPVLSDIKLWRIPLILAAMVAAILGGRRARVTVLLAVILLVLSDQISSHVLKPLISRQRPCHVLEGVRLLVPCRGRLSFPSSHATNNFAIWTLMMLRHKKLGAYLFVFPLGVAYSRVYVGVHYPLDVVGGAILGALCAFCVVMISEYAVVRPLRRRREMRAPQNAKH
jgi:undecaprenyl-diphosphatase